MNAIFHTAPANAYTGLDRFLRTRLLRQLDALEGRAVELHDALGSECVGRGDAPPAPTSTPFRAFGQPTRQARSAPDLLGRSSPTF